MSDFDHFVGTTPTRRAHPSLRSSAKSGGRPTTPDIERNRRVEQAAINAVRSHFGNKEAIDRQAHNCGWDLEFVTPEYKYCIEVKGNSGNQPKAELSENEYRAMRQVMAGEFDGGKYRLAIVTDALSLPKLYLFAFQGGDQWKCELTGREITCEEKTRARLD